MDFKNYKSTNIVYTILVIILIWNIIYDKLKYFIIKYVPLELQGQLLSISVVSIIFLFFFLYDKWLWKKIPFLTNIRNVSGRYEGILKSNYNGCDYPIVIEIIQTASKINITQYTQNEKGISTSKSMNEQLNFDNNNLYSLKFFYRNAGDLLYDEFDPHEGFCQIEFDKERLKIVGTYFTNRKIQTKGNIKANKISKKILGGYKIC